MPLGRSESEKEEERKVGRQKRREQGSEGKRKDKETSIKFQNSPGLQDFPGGPVTDSTLPMQGAGVPFLVRELDPTCRNEYWRSRMPQLTPTAAKYIKKKNSFKKYSRFAKYFT